ncbi:FAD-binding oxidoreductase [Curtobacterium sp. MCBD17_028]|uniref:NAD(P)/FAD-dependent oxidoreductase n=1 Tax=Curtobacterium sp. MCBD17_028 TaxID=2175670 RepID=UPI0015E87CDC|nr:FAD-dependent oxidoreductase [Curtobacterium sp. MCBD17_028]
MNQLVTRPKNSGRTADVVVIGAGVLGCAIAVSALRTGRRVTVVDGNRTAGFGSTSSSAGIIRVHAFDAESSAMAAESVLAWEDWRTVTETPAEQEVARFVRCGSYLLEDDGVLDTMAGVMDRAGVRYHEVDGDALAAALPWIDTRRFGPPSRTDAAEFWREPDGRFERALHTPSSGYVGDPALAAQNLAGQAARLGAVFLLGARVVAIDDPVAGSTVLRLADGSTVEGATVVNVAGPGSRAVNALAGVGGDFRVRLEAQRHELHWFRMPEGVDMARDGAHIVDGDLGLNFRPDGEGAVLVGGNGAAVDGVETIDDPDALVATPTRASWFRDAARLARRVPGLRVPATPSGLAGVYDVTEDWLPVYDRTDRDGFFVAMGTSGNQFKTAPVVGDLVVALLEATDAGRDLDTDPVAVTLPRTGRTIDTAAFSRRRTPQTGASRG